MQPCRECRHEVSENAFACPNCGAPYPARAKWDGFGYEYKSALTLFGLPFLHVSFKYRPKHLPVPPSKRRFNYVPVPAKGIIAIGQFGFGIFTIAQFGVGLFTIGQIAVAGFALAQIGVAYSLIAQIGLYMHEGHGQLVWNLLRLVSVGS